MARALQLMVVLGVGTAWPGSVLAPPPVEAAAAIVHVDATAGGADDGSSWADAYPDLQDALTVAVAGDEIRVAQGTYRAASSDPAVSFELVDGVRMRGGYATGGSSEPDPALHPSILTGDLAGDDGPGFLNNDENTYQVVTGSGVGSATTLDGFVVTGGNAFAAFGTTDEGAGISLVDSSPSITSTTVTGNRAVHGGGINIEGGSPSITHSAVTGNDAMWGGGIRTANGATPTIVGTTITGNAATWNGGGIANDTGSPAIVGSDVSSNTATWGGGIDNVTDSFATIVNTTVTGNSATYGGGIHNQTSRPTIVNSLVVENGATDFGGGIANETGRPTVINTTVANNTAPLGPAMYSSRSIGVSVVNSILWAPGEAIFHALGSTTTVSYSDIRGWTGGGIGTIDADPRFVGSGDYRLLALSPAREAGNNSAAVADQFDIDGDLDLAEPTPDLDERPRVHGTIDMGAYEGSDTPLITPYGFLAFEGSTGSHVYDLPVYLSDPATVPVTVDWATVDAAANPRVAQAGTDFVAASGTVTFAPGETLQSIPIEIIGDTLDEEPLLWGEWGLVRFSNPSNAALDVATFFGHGLFIVFDDDP